MKTIKQLLDHKGHDVFSVAPDASVLDAIRLMETHGVGALLVLRAQKLAGIVSERDYARKIILRGKNSSSTPVKDIMTRKVVYVSPENSLDECMALMTDKRLRHLPVLQGAELIGVISIGDIVKAMISEKDFIIEQMAKYISGG